MGFKVNIKNSNLKSLSGQEKNIKEILNLPRKPPKPNIHEKVSSVICFFAQRLLCFWSTFVWT